MKNEQLKRPLRQSLGGLLCVLLSLAELGSATGCLEAVLRSFLSRFSLVFRAFPDFSLFSYPMW